MGGFGPSEFRNVMGRFVSGVTVVTVRDSTGPHGVTVNAVPLMRIVQVSPACVTEPATAGFRATSEA